jgi:hypothetical protein
MWREYFAYSNVRQEVDSCEFRNGDKFSTEKLKTTRLCGTPKLHPGCFGFKSRSRGRVSWLCFEIFLSSFRKILAWYLTYASHIFLTSFSIQYSVIILPFRDTKSELLTAPLNKRFMEIESELLYDWRFTINQFVLAPSPLIPTTSILLNRTLAVTVFM